MSRLSVLTALTFSLLAGIAAYGDDPVFKSDVAMTRVDAQVVDRTGRPITGLRKSDFVVKVDGHTQPIRNFASENMPIDILLLLDVSGSMEPHVEKIARAAHQALRVLADKDRVAIMVFDNSTRVRLPFTSNLDDVASELNHVLRAEHFNGGTRITSALVSAATYVGRQARPDARRAIVILTDDETQDSEDEPRVESALARANTVLSFLEAPYEVPTMGGGGSPRRHGTWGGGGGGFPGGGGGWPGGGGGWPGGGGMPGGIPGGGMGGDPSHTAGTSTIAQDTGGDTMQVQEASALEDTLNRLRQRYALHFYLPEGAKADDRQSVRVELAPEAKIRYLDSEIHYRRVFMSGNTGANAGPMSVTRSSDPGDPIPDPVAAADPAITNTTAKHRAAVNEDSGPHINTVTPDGGDSPAAAPSTAPATPAPKTGGWPKAANPNPN